jgi:hypothetical protein
MIMQSLSKQEVEPNFLYTKLKFLFGWVLSILSVNLVLFSNRKRCTEQKQYIKSVLKRTRTFPLCTCIIDLLAFTVRISLWPLLIKPTRNKL